MNEAYVDFVGFVCGNSSSSVEPEKRVHAYYLTR